MARPIQDSTRSKRSRAAEPAPPAPGRLARLRQHRLWRDIAMIPVVCLVLFLFASLLTYAPTDPGWSQSGGVTSEIHNWGGRIGAAQALLGTALKIKPILTFGTEITPVGRVRTRRRAHQQMIAYLHELHDREATEWFVQHAQSPDDADALVAEGTAILGNEPLFRTQVGPVLGAHLGSGMLVGGIGCAPQPA